MNSKLAQWVKQHPSLTQADSLKTICQPLKRLGIVYFSVVIINERQQMTCLASNPDFFKLYFDKGYHQYDLHRSQLTKPHHERYLLWDNIVRVGQSKALHEDFMSFDQGHTFSIVSQTDKEKICYHFATKLGDSSAPQRYFDNLGNLKQFIAYFNEKIRQDNTLAKAYETPLSLESIGGYLTENPLLSSQELYPIDLALDRIYLPTKTSYLTQREFNILHWLAAGKTFEETALILSITPRTVKAHVKNIKDKTGYDSLFQLGMLYQSLSHLQSPE